MPEHGISPYILHITTKQLITDEGIRLKPYLCTSNRLSIGIGRNLEDNGISEEEAIMLLTNDIYKCNFDLMNIFPAFITYSAERRAALINLRFNLGGNGFRKFKRMINAVRKGDWNNAAVEALDSKWAKQVKGRANRIAQALRE